MIFKYNQLTDRLSKDETILHIARCFETLRVEYKSLFEDSILATHFGKDHDTDLYVTKNEIMETDQSGNVIDATLAEISVKRGPQEIYRSTYMLDGTHSLEDILEELWNKDYVLEIEYEEEERD